MTTDVTEKEIPVSKEAESYAKEFMEEMDRVLEKENNPVEPYIKISLVSDCWGDKSFFGYEGGKEYTEAYDGISDLKEDNPEFEKADIHFHFGNAKMDSPNKTISTVHSITFKADEKGEYKEAKAKVDYHRINLGDISIKDRDGKLSVSLPTKFRGGQDMPNYKFDDNSKHFDAIEGKLKEVFITLKEDNFSKYATYNLDTEIDIKGNSNSPSVEYTGNFDCFNLKVDELTVCSIDMAKTKSGREVICYPSKENELGKLENIVSSSMSMTKQIITSANLAKPEKRNNQSKETEKTDDYSIDR